MNFNIDGKITQCMDGDTYHVEAHFHGSEPKMFDVRSAVSSGIRDAQRRRRERGGA